MSMRLSDVVMWERWMSSEEDSEQLSVLLTEEHEYAVLSNVLSF